MVRGDLVRLGRSVEPRCSEITIHLLSKYGCISAVVYGEGSDRKVRGMDMVLSLTQYFLYQSSYF